MIEFGSVIVLSLSVCGRVLRSSSIITIRQYFKFDSQKLKTNNTKLTIDLCLKLFTFGLSRLLLPRAVNCQTVTYMCY